MGCTGAKVQLGKCKPGKSAENDGLQSDLDRLKTPEQLSQANAETAVSERFPLLPPESEKQEAIPSDHPSHTTIGITVPEETTTLTNDTVIETATKPQPRPIGMNREGSFSRDCGASDSTQSWCAFSKTTESLLDPNDEKCEQVCELFRPSRLSLQQRQSISKLKNVLSRNSVLANRVLSRPAPSLKLPTAQMTKLNTELRRNVRDHFNMCELETAELFNRFDVDGSGYLDREQIRCLLIDQWGHFPDDDELDWLMLIADSDTNGKLNKEELLLALQAWNGYSQLPDDLKELFDEHDADGNGYLDLAEFQSLLQAVTGEEVKSKTSQGYLRLLV